MKCETKLEFSIEKICNRNNRWRKLKWTIQRNWLILDMQETGRRKKKKENNNTENTVNTSQI